MTRRWDRVLTRRWALAAAATAVLVLSAIGYFSSKTSSPQEKSPEPSITFTPLPQRPSGPLSELSRLLVPDSSEVRQP